ncbi:yjeF C-terminal region, hydroxyethylthiazole kinase-related/yjeF N-terminal region [Enterobacter hormaechei]|nr:yjeF C-terminal region, hydroxyethylthiazole kinase-related/yjeF N-terminal region [Enterobacter hormaechei]
MKKNPASIPHSIWHADDLRRAEKEAADSLGITLYELMQRAGEAAFNVARTAYPDASHYLILCGHGNNGGDGYVVARLAVAAGCASPCWRWRATSRYRKKRAWRERPG